MQGQSRIAALDSVRGIAALFVVLHHSTLIFIVEPPDWSRAVVGGRSSVIVFFVLSGYVLAHSLNRSGEPFLSFAVRRVCRIWLPFAAAIFLAALVRTAVDPHPIPALTDWFNASWISPATPALILRHLVMTGTSRDVQLDNVSWSLVYEMRISLVFPLLFAAAVRWPLMTLLSALLLHAVSAVTEGCNAHCTPYASADLSEAVAFTAYFVVFFSVGIALWFYGEILSQFARMIPWWASVGCAAVLLSKRTDLAVLLGAALIIGAAASGSLDRLLLTPVALWLGRVSYSLYLLHLIVLIAFVHVLHAYAPLWTVVALAVAAALALSEGFYRLVEVNSQRLGKRLVRYRIPVRATAPPHG